MAAMDATLTVMERENVPARAAKQGATLRAALEEWKKRFAWIGDVRGMGLMQALELVEDRTSKAPAPKLAAALMEAGKKRGILLGKGGLYGNTVRLAPPMLISESEMNEALTRLGNALADVDAAR
jgi:4-aminobutyrate aminotransferase-like enzyme